MVVDSEKRTATEVSELVADTLRLARQRYLSRDIEVLAILSGTNSPMFVLTFNDTQEAFIVSVQRKVA